jgi:hypothetical protein
MKANSTSHRLSQGLLAASLMVITMTGSAAIAQAKPMTYAQRMSESSRATEATEWRGRSVARTGATVPNPGTAKIGPQTGIERRAQERSDMAIRTICIGCL